MFDVLEMPLYWPVDVNYHEARAYCTWKGSEYRLPTEAEHHRMRGYEVHKHDSCLPLYHTQTAFKCTYIVHLYVLSGVPVVIHSSHAVNKNLGGQNYRLYSMCACVLDLCFRSCRIHHVMCHVTLVPSTANTLPTPISSTDHPL